MNPDLQKELLNRLDALAAKLGTTASQLWEILIRQARVEIFTDILSFVLASGMLWLLAKWWLSILKRVKEQGDIFDISPLEVLPAALLAIFGVIISGIAVVALFEIPTLIFNPQYWALRQLLERAQ